MSPSRTRASRRHPRFAPRPHHLAMAAALVLGALPAVPLQAATCTWIPASGNWTAAGNWSCGFVPGASDIAVVSGGQLSTLPGGQFLTTPTILSNAGTVAISDNAGLTLQGSNTNTGSITLGSVGNATELRISGAMSINGNGTITSVNNTQANRIVAFSAGSDVLTLGAGQTIQGTFAIGAGGSLGVVNNGSIVASPGSGITINAQGGVSNNNLIRGDGATLQITNTTVNQGAGGVLSAINNGAVRLSSAVIIGGTFSSTGTGAVVTAGGTNSSVSGVTNTGTLNIVDNSTLTMAGTLTNNGTITMTSVGNGTDLLVSGSRSLDGTGTVTLSNTLSNRIRGDNATLTIGSGQTVSGSANIGAGSVNFTLNNAGTIVATSSSPLLINASSGVSNTGTLRADGGTLQLQTTINSAGGQIEARNGSRVELLNGAVINNAAFSATGAGSVITTTNGATVRLGGGTVNGPMTIADNSNLRLTANATYNGTLSMGSVGNNTDLQIDGVRTLNGTATISLSNTQANRIVGANAAGDSFTTTGGITIQGSGTIGAGSAGFAFNNGGTVIATSSSPLLINAAGGVNNSGTLRADGGTLRLQTTINSAGGQIEARNGSAVELLDGSVINNAAFSATGVNSLVTTVNGATVSMGGGTVSGPMRITDNSRLRLTADAVYNGALSMTSVGNNTDLQISGNRTLSGTATISMSNTQANRILGASPAGDVLTTASGITIQGSGSIGAGTAFGLVNNGTIVANLGNGITLGSTGSVVNNNVMRADGSTFLINGTTVNQGPGGVLDGINGGVVRLAGGSSIVGGTFTSSSGGSVATAGGNTATVSGVTNSGTLNIVDNSVLLVGGTLTNNGSIAMGSVGNSTDLRVTGNRLIDGTGTITLSNTTANRLAANAAGDSLTLGAGQTLRGAGQIGAGGPLNFTNNGTVIGDQSSPIVVSSFGTVTNNRTLRADGGTVTITGTTLGQGAVGVIEAINGGVVNLVGNSTITGGSFSTAGGGQVRTNGGNTATIGNLTNGGTFNVVDNSFLVLQGTVTNIGSLSLGSVGNTTDLRVSGTVGLNGGGTITISNTAANRVVADGSSGQLDVGFGQTIQGAGSIGAGTALALNNRGTFTANQSSPMTMLVGAGGALTNLAGGLMQAVIGGTLNVNNVLGNNGTLAANGGVVNANAGFTGTGTVQISGAGRMNVGASSSTGNLTHSGSAANGLALGTSNITVSGDYTNASFGTGNAFDRRANVTGTGQILAGGNVSQVITGTGVSNGNSTNATLTIGNVRVGNNDFNYQIANAGSVGPTLRGALQTAVNGGNITDPRLSGSGVTAANYNAGGPGGNSGNLTVTFNAASAGPLAALSGQAVNLRSNFDNIADQKLNIALAGGAAAYNAALGSTTTPAQLSNQRVGGTGTTTLQIANTAAPGPFSEDLNATIASLGGQATASGSVSGRVAGTNNTGAGAILAGVNTATSGAKTGVVNLNYQSAGTVNGVSNGLSPIGVGGQTVTVSGNVYQPASGALQTPALNFGTVQVGQQVSQSLVIRNTASGAAGFVEDLNASFGAASGTGASLISGTGSLNGILAGTNSNAGNGSMVVSVNTSAAGAVNGSIAVNYTSAGAVAGASNGLGQLAVGSESFGVNGTIQATANVINQASPLINNPSINLGAVRVGGASPTAQVSLSNQATVAPQAALNASIASGGALVTTNGGTVSLLLPGQTNTTGLQVGLATSTAGNFTGANAGTAVVSLVSDASNVGNCAPNCQLTLAPQTISVSGKVYTPAVGQLATTLVDFGVVRVGDTVSARNITVDNTAASSALNDTLRASLSGVSGPFSGGAAVSGVAAQASGTIAVGLNTGTAGVFNQSGSVGFLSQNPDMADVSAGAAGNVQVRAQVNRLANADFDFLSGLGLLTQINATDYVLDLGNLLVGSNVHTTLGLGNDVLGPADVLGGAFDLSAVDDFTLDADWSQTIAGLQAGSSVGGLDIDFVAAAVGAVSDEVIFNGRGTNASDTTGLAQSRRLIIRANVVDLPSGNVPEPGSLMLVLAAGLGALLARRRRAVAH